MLRGSKHINDVTNKESLIFFRKRTMTADVRDILDLEQAPTPEVTKETILGTNPEKQKKKLFQSTQKVSKRPEGMHREVYALLYTDSKDAPPLFQTDTGIFFFFLLTS